MATRRRRTLPAVGRGGADESYYASIRRRTAAGTPTVAPAAAAPVPPVAAPAYDRNWYQAISTIYDSYGLGSLAPLILQYAQQGIEDPDVLEVLLRQTPEFKQRFKANEQRVAAGLNALSIGEYLNLENEYADRLRGSGLPSGFYDSKDDFTNWIAANVSPDEISERIGMAQQAVASSDPTIRQALGQFYGLGDGDLVAHFLDPQRATTLFQTRREFSAAGIGAAALQQGLSADKARAELFADQGVTAVQARAGYGNVAEVLPTGQKLGSIYGQAYGQRDAEDEFLGGLASARRGRETLAQKETDNFSGSSGVNRTSLSRRTRGAY